MRDEVVTKNAREQSAALESVKAETEDEHEEEAAPMSIRAARGRKDTTPKVEVEIEKDEPMAEGQDQGDLADHAVGAEKEKQEQYDAPRPPRAARGRKDATPKVDIVAEEPNMDQDEQSDVGEDDLAQEQEEQAPKSSRPSRGRKDATPKVEEDTLTVDREEKEGPKRGKRASFRSELLRFLYSPATS